MKYRKWAPSHETAQHLRSRNYTNEISRYKFTFNDITDIITS